MQAASFLLVVTLLLGTGTPSFAGFADNWISSNTGSAPAYSEGQKRGYLSGGSFSARWMPQNEYPLTISLPKASSGCGGIDLFMGGFSFLGFDYLVQKLQAILMNAPALAFDLALKAMAAAASDSMKGLDSIIEVLNAAQLDDCAIASSVVSAVGESGYFQDNIQPVWQQVIAKEKQVAGAIDSWFQFSEESKGNDNTITPADAKRTVEGCSDDMKNLFLGYDAVSNDFLGASFLDRMKDKVQPQILADHADLFRGLIGDIKIGSAAEAFKVSTIPPCPQNSKNRQDGSSQLWQKNLAGVCTEAADVNGDFQQYAYDRLAAIRTKMRTKVELDDADWAFINSTPVPVMSAMRIGLQSKNDMAIMNQLSYMVSSALLNAMLLDLYDRLSNIVDAAKIGLSISAGGGLNESKCQTITIQPDVRSGLEEMKKSATDVAAQFQRDYEKTMSEMQTSLTFINHLEDLRGQVNNILGAQFGTSFGARIR